MKPTRLIPVMALAATPLFASQAVLAYSAGDTFVRGGFAQTDTRSDNGVLDSVSSGETGFTFGAGYLFTDQFGIELNSSEKIEHTFSAGGESNTLDRMPVNLMANYYPLGGFDSRVQPYVGAGLNYTRFSGEPEGVDARRSYGAVGQVGVDLAVTDNFMLNGFANYADVDSRISVDGERIGTAKVDPMTIGGGVTFRF
ncbi:OmpW/AlkL family protein [Billgrantia kenyensis]|uniref:OmpW family protein n=1 Tax=Billgrantia kenyensis TaxID=321266 RepID=A0A7V9W2R6_9GAMM|nr:OmpW family outer membrane protein [Halomonas kenyensis]MBA2780003.1 OmpW family protein [Halomonas kenyensis]MCG6662982.1 OmpW family protein [Halomonas kenyensis]